MAYIYQTKTGKWGYTVSLGIDPVTMKQRQKTKSTFKNEKEAIRAAALLEKQYEDGELQSESRKKLFPFIVEFLDWYGRHAKESSVVVRQMCLDRLCEGWDNLQLRQVTKKMYQDRIYTLSEQYSKSYLTNIHTSARILFQRAVEMELVKKDPTEGVKLPNKEKQALDDGDEDERLNYLEKDELIEFLQLAKKDGLKYDYLFFTLLAYSGMRIGEMLALKWADVDFEENTIKISKTIFFHNCNTKNFKLLPPKTKSSKRMLRMDDGVMSLLKKHKAAQNEHRLRYREYYEDMNFVFAREDGYPMMTWLVSNRLRRLLKKSNIHKQITPHGFRHTHTSLLIEAGVGVKEIQQRLGHSDYKTTMNIYAHMTKNMEEKAAEKFSAFMQNLL
ncbi:site-specific integrase [Domibacillus tundrae]|uniref:site-specific integrase n=1 Tax=Domibacillus tundrae TaxID=1587527 RepID=UPI000617E1F9|nr:site-specific integrase [Domibacillus tundrae]